jgi:signal transduction histidine kinase
MLHSLRLRLLLTLVLVVAVAISLVSVFGGLATTRLFREYVQARFERDHVVAAGVLQSTGGDGSLTSLRAQAEELGQTMGADIILVDPNGDVLVDTQGTLDGKTLVLPAMDAPPPDHSSGLFTELIGSAQPANPGSDSPVILVVRPNPSGASSNAVFIQPVFPRGGGRRVDSPLFGTINRAFLLAAAASGVGALALALLLSRRIVSPVEALTVAAHNMEKGDLSQRVDVHSSDEIGELGRAFNAMADSLNRQENLRRTMVADVAHELRTPLSNIRGYLEAVRDRVVQPDEKVVDSLYEEAMLLTRLVNDLQELALAEAGQLKLARRPADIRALIEKTLTALRPQLAAKGIEAKVSLPEQLPEVEVDPERIGQVLHNLLDNAVHYTPQGGEIAVEAAQGENEIEVRVSDDGPGIPPEHLPYVFERFYRADRARARATGGAGLGLAIVKQLVQAHGGQVRAESETGKGATFTFTLPLAAPATA